MGQLSPVNSGTHLACDAAHALPVAGAVALHLTHLDTAKVIARLAQIARFGAIGLLCFALSTAVLATLCEVFHVYYLAAFIATFFVSSVTGYILNGRYTFAGHSRFNGHALSRYITVNAILLGINSLLLRVLVETCGVWYITATVILAAVNVPITFAAHRLLTYRDATTERVGSA